jgi:hypothetical protein
MGLVLLSAAAIGGWGAALGTIHIGSKAKDGGITVMIAGFRIFTHRASRKLPPVCLVNRVWGARAWGPVWGVTKKKWVEASSMAYRRPRPVFGIPGPSKGKVLGERNKSRK